MTTGPRTEEERPLEEGCSFLTAWTPKQLMSFWFASSCGQSQSHLPWLWFRDVWHGQECCTCTSEGSQGGRQHRDTCLVVMGKPTAFWL